MSRRALLIAAFGVFFAPIAPLAPSSGSLAAPPDVVISEFMASNTTTLFDENGEASDWIELWNRSSEPVDLVGWHLADSGATWTFPTTVIAPGEYLVVFASDKNRLTGPNLHTNFKLSAGGEYLALTDGDGAVAAEFAPAFPAQLTNISYGLGSDNLTGYLATPTPRAANSETASETAATPVLSRAGGYITGPVSLTATSSTVGATLRYTTDGSTPTATHGTQYTGAVTIASSSPVRMVASKPGFRDSAVVTATFLVMSEVLAQTGTPAGWPSAPVNGQVFSYGFDQGSAAPDPDEIQASLEAAPTLSVTTDQANLTDPNTGIYTNPLRSGSGWERPASVELIDGANGFQINGGIRIKGGSSRGVWNPKHSFRLFFEDNYAGALNYPLFGPDGAQSFSGLDLRSEQNLSWNQGSDRNTMLRDVWLRDSEAAVSGDSTRSQWVHLFLNGQYWGLYMLKEQVSAHGAAQTWGGNDADYDVVKVADDFGYEVRDGDDDQWLAIWDVIVDGVITDGEFAQIQQLVNLDSLIDYYLLNVAAGNKDGTPTIYRYDLWGNNWFAVGSATHPFEFFVDDGELLMGGDDHDPLIDRTGPFAIADANSEWNPHFLHPGWINDVLLTRPEYRAKTRDRATVLLANDGALGTDASLDRWIARRDEVAQLVDAEAARWGNFAGQHFGRSTWLAEVTWVENEWFPGRNQTVRQQLIADRLWAFLPGVADEGYAPAVRLATVTG